MLEIHTQHSSTQSHSTRFLSEHRTSSFPSHTAVCSILVLLIFLQVVLVSTSSAQSCQYSPYWGENGELWNPNGPLKDYSRVGYHEGNDPLPYQRRAASRTFGAGRFTITDRIMIGNGVLRGAGKEKTTLYFPKGMVGMGYPCPGNNCWDWADGVIQLKGGAELGVEDLTIEFPPHPYTHHNGQGFNGISLRDCRHCWVSNVKVINADEGIGIFGGDHNTIDRVDIMGGYHNYIHMSLTTNNLVTNFQVSGGSIHGLAGNWDTHGGVFSNGSGNPMVIEPDHNGPTTTGLLYSNMQGTGGSANKLSDTFLWNYMNQKLCPLDIHQAQLAKRLGIEVPVANAGPDQTVFEGTAVVFDSSGNGNSFTHTWDFGDGNSATGTVVSHTYTLAGNYTVTLMVSNGKMTDSDTARVQVISYPYRQLVNAGGGGYTDGMGKTWGQDRLYSPGSWGYTGGKTYGISVPIANTTADPLYQSERFGTFRYTFDVPDGEYDVTLHFAEIYWQESGQRLFDVLIEDVLVLDNYDIYAKAGHDTAISVRLPHVQVTDGKLRIDFVSVKDSAKVSAIDIQTTDMSLKADAGPDQTISIGDRVTFDGSGSFDPDGNALAYHWDLGDGHTASGAKVTHSYADTGTYTVILTVNNGSASSHDTALVRVLDDPSTQYTQLVNAGGGSYTDSGGSLWSPDQPYSSGGWGYTGGKKYTTPGPIANTTADPLYQSERYGTFSYRFDVPHGRYDVTLYMAETFWNGAGQRLFDVLIDGVLVLDNYDIYKAAGHDSAMTLAFEDVLIQDGQLNIDFVTVKDNAKVSAIKIQRVGD